MSTQSESRFWDKFIVKTTSYSIKPSVARLYVRHADVSTTMIYTHVLNKPGLSVVRPFDTL